MHGATLITSAPQKIANPKYALPYAAYVEMAAAVAICIDPSALHLVKETRVQLF